MIAELQLDLARMRAVRRRSPWNSSHRLLPGSNPVSGTRTRPGSGSPRTSEITAHMGAPARWTWSRLRRWTPPMATTGTLEAATTWASRSTPLAAPASLVRVGNTGPKPT